jgi:probable rRNA maturation factor
MKHRVHLQGAPRSHASTLQRAVLHALALVEAGPGALTLRVTDEAEIRRLNADFADADHATDVLSFADGEADADGPGTYFGDVVIALPLAEAQALAAGHPVDAELALLAVHGTLHLLGHDHRDAGTRRRMWDLQDRILGDIGCPIRSPHGDP